MSFSRPFSRPVSLLASAVLAIPLALLSVSSASAAVPTVGLGVLTDYSVLGGSAVTNTGSSVLGGSLGVSPGTAISGFDTPGGPGIVVGGSIYTPPAADSARAAAGTAYIDAAGRTGTSVPDVELGGKTLVAGVYTAGSTGTFGLTSTLTLTGDVDDVWIFQTDTTLITAAASSVVLSGGAQACNVFWKVGSSATLGASSQFAGTILAAASISLDDNVNVVGRLIAGTGAVTLINDVITRPACVTDEDDDDSTPPTVVTPPIDTDPTVVTPPTIDTPPTVVTPPTVDTPPTVVTPPTVDTPPTVVTPPTDVTPPTVVTPPTNVTPPTVVTPVNPAVSTDQSTLAATGLADSSALMVGAGFILMLGTGLVALRLRRSEVRRRNS